MRCAWLVICAISGMHVEAQKAVPICYRGKELETAYRLDMLVDRQLVVELKAVDELTALHHAQLLSYLRLSNYRVGLLINFNVLVLHTGIRRVVHNWPE